MLELADKTDFWNFNNEEFECASGNIGRRISLIKQFEYSIFDVVIHKKMQIL